jgi:hypothetical protein
MWKVRSILPKSRLVGITQGTYYTATGLWPILSMRSFEAVTGPKQEQWLVKTVGALITAIGGNLALWSAPSHRNSKVNSVDYACALGMSAALALATIDCVYAAKERISKIYLLDAAVELALVIAWLGSSD